MYFDCFCIALVYVAWSCLTYAFLTATKNRIDKNQHKPFLVCSIVNNVFGYFLSLAFLYHYMIVDVYWYMFVEHIMMFFFATFTLCLFSITFFSVFSDMRDILKQKETV